MTRDVRDALELGRAGRWDEAIAMLEAAIAESETADLHSYLGTTFRSCSRWEEADAAYARALAIETRHVGALWGLGLSRGMQGDVEGAAEILASAVAAAPGFAPPRFQLALTLLELGDTEAALEHAEVVRGLDERYAARLDAILGERGLLLFG